jgi:hypothetical protein
VALLRADADGHVRQERSQPLRRAGRWTARRRALVTVIGLYIGLASLGWLPAPIGPFGVPQSRPSPSVAAPHRLPLNKYPISSDDPTCFRPTGTQRPRYGPTFQPKPERRR